MNTNEAPGENKEVINILAAEDDELNRDLLCAILRKLGFTYKVAENGRRAVELFKNEHFDLVFLDIQMPVMDGYEVLEVIRNIEKSRGTHTPVIAMSGYSSPEEKKKSLELGMDYHMVKPFRPDDLRKMIGEILIQEKEEGLSADSDIQSDSSNNSVDKASYTEEDIQRVFDKISLDLSFFEELTTKFEASSGELLYEIRRAIADGERTSIRRDMHTLKGEFLAFNAYQLCRMAEAMENMAEQENADTLRRALEELEKEVGQLMQALTAFIGSRKQLPE